MSSGQKKIIADQKSKIDKIEEISDSITLTEIKLKFLNNIEKSADFCYKICDNKNNLINSKSYISANAYPCIVNCLNKRHDSIKRCYEVRILSNLDIIKESVSGRKRRN